MYGISKALPGTFQLPVRLSELLLVFRGHELIRFNPPVWFLVALFNCNILFYIVHYLRDKHVPALFAVTLLIGVTGFWLGKERIELPFYIDVAMTALPFYFAGFWIRRYNFFLYPHHRFDKLIPVFVVLAVAAMYFTATPLGMRTNNYPGNIFQVYLAAFAGIHGPLLFFLRPLVSRFLADGWVQSVVLLVLTLLVCLALTPVIIRLIPQFVAQKDLLNRKP